MKLCRYTIRHVIVSVVCLLAMLSLVTGCALTNLNKTKIVDSNPPKSVSQELDFLETKESELSQPSRQYMSMAKNQQSLLSSIQEAADEDFRMWMLRPSEVDLPQINKPEMPVLPDPVKVTRGEFESSVQFELRVQRIRDKHKDTVNDVMATYQKRVSAYNTVIEKYNDAVELEYQQRQQQKDILYLDFLEQSVNKILARSGMPRLTNPSYNADTEAFNTNLVMGDDTLLCALNISVPLAEAQFFKQNLNNVETALGFSYDEGLLRLSKVIVRYNEQEYASQIISGAEDERNIGIVLTHSPNSITIQPDPANLSSLTELSQSLGERDQVDFTTLMQEETPTSQ